ncbi:hypothetical protein GOP56_19465 [Brevibacillus sp. 7WMA2]|uniref:LiaF transmembrane domain-containing protein n=1 Tax=Brevibacillus TaxID=55080 RepID=UPI0002403313|nr:MULTISPECIES: hypothetical protein [Brevibacillus]AUM63689.1 hypothetical protein C0R09_03615 [Brevibacillus laterosporus]ERM17651.1 membrane protein [Brevibacillus laterosporus PE36]MBA4534712.1 hypothetical protein [Brevibacillus halotolerans]MCR8965516.1 hypothetical protein [Brevibacillus laterosporus]MCR8997238.1 hypothetical protein [Brevibacillus laterosporus]
MQGQSGKLFLGLTLIVVGVLVLLDKLGLGIDRLIPMFIAGLLMVYGCKKVLSAGSTGNKGWGIFVFLFGLLMLLNKLSLLFGCLLAIAIIYFGCKLMKGQRHTAPYESTPSMWEREWAQSVLREDKLDRWENELKKRQHKDLF